MENGTIQKDAAASGDVTRGVSAGESMALNLFY